MNFGKVFTDFEKSYGKKCERAYFMGKPIIFFSCSGTTLGTAVSAGGYAAVAKRDDDRVTVKFSDSEDFLSCNKMDFKYNKDKKICDLLLRAEKYGVQTGGADILFGYETKLTHPYEPLLLTALEVFCKNTPSAAELIKHFDNFEKNMISISSKENAAVLFDGQRARYLPFSDDEIKLVLCSIPEKTDYCVSSGKGRTRDAVSALGRGDYKGFGEVLNAQSRELIKKCPKKVRKLLETELELNDAYGSGILEDGGIYSIVKNNRVDAYMHNLGTEYEKYFGSYPDFYVTRAENSGIYAADDQ